MVYLVEYRQSGEDTMSYLAKVHLSAAKACAGAEFWTARAGWPGIDWQEGSFGVLIGEPADSGNGPSWTIVPLPVHSDSESESDRASGR